MGCVYFHRFSPSTADLQLPTHPPPPGAAFLVTFGTTLGKGGKQWERERVGNSQQVILQWEKSFHQHWDPSQYLIFLKSDFKNLILKKKRLIFIHPGNKCKNINYVFRSYNTVLPFETSASKFIPCKLPSPVPREEKPWICSAFITMYYTARKATSWIFTCCHGI